MMILFLLGLCHPMPRRPAPRIKNVRGVSQSCHVHVVAHRPSERKRAVLSAFFFLQVLDSRTNRAVIGVPAAALRSLVTKQECAVEVSLFKVCVCIYSSPFLHLVLGERKRG